MRDETRRDFLRTLTGSAVGLTVGGWPYSIAAQAPQPPTNVRVGDPPSGSTTPGLRGTLAHGATLTITGSGFGTKSPAAPAVWDDCSATSVMEKWPTGTAGELGGAWTGNWYYGFPCSNPYWDMAYRVAPFRGQAAPHGRVGRFIGACRGDPSSIGDVAVWHKFHGVTWPCKIFASWYLRYDDQFGDVRVYPDAGSDNVKIYSWSNGVGPYLAVSQYMGVGGGWQERAPRIGFAQYIGLGQDITGPPTTNFIGNWVKIEAQICYDPVHGSYQVWNNGQRAVWAIDLPNMTAAPGDWNVSLMGYTRPYGYDTQWTYAADMYVQRGWARVVLGNAATLDASTRREMQIPSVWSDTSITLTMNLGAFGNTGPAWIHVVNDNGVVVQTYPVTLGSQLL